MISISPKKLALFFTLISSFYVLAPVLSANFFDFQVRNTLEYTALSLTLTVSVVLTIVAPRRKVEVNFDRLNVFRAFTVGVLLFILLVYVLTSLYGGFSAAFYSSYIERTGVYLSGSLRYLFFPTLSFAAAFVSIASAQAIFSKQISLSSKMGLLFLTALFVVLFLISGNRNLILWSISLPLAIFVGTYSYVKITALSVTMVIASIITASFRNVGFGNLNEFSFPPWEYWNPIVHEYGTTYRVYDLLIGGRLVVDGYDIPLTSYFVAFVNLLPSIFKPEGFLGFSNSLSFQYASFGEGLGNSPVAEVAYNWYFPAIAFQILPFIILRRLIGRKIGAFGTRFGNAICLAALGAFCINFFNFWRIGFSELVKINASFIVAFVALYWLLTTAKMFAFSRANLP